MSASDRKTITLAREELHEQVWTKPMCHLAKEYGLYHADLAAICQKHSIPRPPVGYWSKKEFGKAPPQAPLPACEDNQLRMITLRRSIDEGEVRTKLLSLVTSEQPSWNRMRSANRQ